MCFQARKPPSNKADARRCCRRRLSRCDHADIIGFATIAAWIALLWLLVPVRFAPHWIWPVAFVALATGAWISWHHPAAPTSPKGWAKYVVEGLVFLCVMPVIDIAIWSLKLWHMQVTFSALGACTIVAAAGLARSLAIGEQDNG